MIKKTDMEQIMGLKNYGYNSFTYNQTVWKIYPLKA